MDKPMTLAQLSYCSNYIRSQLATGQPLATATSRLIKRQPEYAQFWAGVSQRIRGGVALSSLLGHVWPPEGVAVVSAGEHSGKLAEVLEEYCTSINLRRRLAASAKKLYYPLTIVTSSLAISLGAFVTVVPAVAETMRSASGRGDDPTGLSGLAVQTQQWLLANWVTAVVIALVVGYVAVSWVRSPSGRAEVSKMLVAAPLFKGAISELSFGLWTRYVAMSVAAGIPTIDALKQTKNVLPLPMRPGVDALVRDLSVHHRSLTESVDPEKLPVDDLRSQWPGFVADAFIQGEETSQLEEHLTRASDELVRSGEAAFERALKAANFLATVVAGGLVMSTMLISYLPMLNSFKHLR